MGKHDGEKQSNRDRNNFRSAYGFGISKKELRLSMVITPSVFFRVGA